MRVAVRSQSNAGLGSGFSVFPGEDGYFGKRAEGGVKREPPQNARLKSGLDDMKIFGSFF